MIETERLILREILPSDADAMFELDSDPEVHRYLGNASVKSRKKILEIIDFIRGQYNVFGIGRWAVVLKENNKFIGWAGLKYVNEPMNALSGYYDLGYRFTRKYWGKGYATEASAALMDYAFNKLKIPCVYALIEADNLKSRRVLEKVGFHEDKPMTIDGVPHVQFKAIKPT